MLDSAWCGTDTGPVSDTVLYVAAMVVSFLISAVAMRRYWRGDRRLAGLVFAPVVVMIVAPVVALIGDLGLLGWAGIPLLAVEILVLAVMARALLRITRIGITSRTEQEFEERSTDAMSEPVLVNLGLVLIGGLIAVIVLVAYGIARATGG